MSSRGDDAAGHQRVLDPPSLGALVVYLGLSLFFFGRTLPGHFPDVYIGTGNDPSISMWFFVWWPYALVHRLDPLFTDLLWVPHGINLAWTTAISLPSFFIWPVTASLGPVAAYNAMSLASPALAAWTAFLLCRYVCRAWWPALLGGYIFGFSAYMLGHQLCGHLNQTLIFLVPLAVLLAARAIAGELAAGEFIAAMTALLVAQFLTSVEVFATMTAMGGMALFLAWSFAPPDMNKPIVTTSLRIAVAYAIAAVILSPYLYRMFAFGAPPGEIWSLDAYSADLLNFVVPAPTSTLGVIPLISRVSAPFRPYSIGEVSAYLGLPLIILAAVYAWRHWREPTGKLLIDSLIVICVLAMGPLLHFRGTVLGGLPGKILPLLPVLNKALPARLMTYAFLVLAIITSIWFAESRFSSALKVAIAATIVVSTLPNLSAAYWTRPDDSPTFFTSTLHRDYLAPGETVLVLPFGIRGSSMLWQAETEMYFRMVGGNTGQLPPEFRNWPIVRAFLNAAYVPDARAQLSAFMAHHAVSTIAVVDGDADAKAWHALASACCAAKPGAGGVTIYRAAPRELATYAGVTAAEMEQQADSTLFDTLLLAADRWLSEGNNLALLTPLRAQQHGLLPASWLTGPTMAGWSILENPVMDSSGRYFCGAWLGPMPDGRPGVGVYGSYAALEPIIAHYRPSAAQIYFPYQHDLRAPQPDTRGLMVIAFDPAKLASAARMVRTSTNSSASQSR